ncbi:PH domain-containing protein [Haloactinomyces albus]|uniref:Low molecular weight protein antigen 6 PH domain-containing protein n=1 Tax=Haloactinomyces albus TaxID=1352928 RepID=A0AAE3Z9G7_9ACTN|nr:PH domain-containing protein [Haloactinomyces albus]MDR7300782.1 hypothetical protein [Haloactinomyces albus]
MSESSAETGRSGTEAADPTGSTVDHEDSGGVRGRTPTLPDRLTFRITPLAIVGVLTVAVCISPAAAAAPWLLWLYLLPVGLLVWILRMRTTVDSTGLTARNVVRKSRIGWGDLQSLRVNERRWVRAVLHSHREVRLPAVRVRDLSRLAAMSGGRLSDPAAETESE